MSRTLAVLALLALALPAVGQAPSCAPTLPVSVRDKSGRWIAIPPEALNISRPRGAQVTATKKQAPRRIVVLIDYSGSMYGAAWTWVAATADQILQVLPPDIEVGIAAFSGRFAWLGGFRAPASAYRAALARTMGRMQPLGPTAFYDALDAAVVRPGGLQPGDAILAVSDGSDNSSRFSDVQIARILERHGVRLFVFSPSKPELKYLPTLLKKVAGAEAVIPPKSAPAAVQTAVAQMWSALAAQTLVTIQSTASGKPEELKLQLTDAWRSDRLLYPENIECPGS